MNKQKKLLLEYINYIRLPGIKENYDETVRLAEKESMGYLDFLTLNLEYEYHHRKNQKISRLLKNSKLPLGKTFENFEMSLLPLKLRQRIKSLNDGSFLGRCENILVFGLPGTGKTHLLCAIAHEQIRNGQKMLFITCSMLVQKLLIAKKNLSLEKLLKKLSTYAGVIIDDMGYVQQNKNEMEVLFTFLAEKYERGSILISSNLPFSKWDRIFHDRMITAAAIDRLVHHSIIIEMEGINSYRTKAAKIKKKEASDIKKIW